MRPSTKKTNAKEDLGAMLAPLESIVKKRRWTLKPELTSAGLNLALRRASDGTPLFDVMLRPKRAGRREHFYAESSRMYAFYSTHPGGELTQAAQLGRIDLMERVRGLLQRHDRVLEALCAGSAHRPGAARPTTRRDGLSRDILDVPKASEEPGEFILRISFRCNLSCPFCFVHLSGKRPDLRSIEAAVNKIPVRSRRTPLVVLSGGEPAGDPRLFKILGLLRQKGLSRICLQSNGVYLQKKQLIEKLERFRIPDYLISLHAHRPAPYNKITGTRGQLPRALRGIRNVLALTRGRLSIMVVINKHNYRILPAHARFLGQLVKPYGKQVGVFYAQLAAVAYRTAPQISVDLARAAPYINEAARRCRAAGLVVERFEGDCALPVCLMNEPGPYAPRKTLPNRDVHYRSIFQNSDLGRAKHPSCRKCRYDPACRGVPPPYAHRFGLKALRAHAQEPI